MKNLFIPCELAVIAKEKGFDEPCLAIYQKNKHLFLGECHGFNMGYDIYAPLYQQIVDWFREKHKLHICVDFDKLKDNDDAPDIELYSFRINEVWSEGKDWSDYRYGFKHIMVRHKQLSYYEALNKAIEEAFNLI